MVDLEELIIEVRASKDDLLEANRFLLDEEGFWKPIVEGSIFFGAVFLITSSIAASWLSELTLEIIAVLALAALFFGPVGAIINRFAVQLLLPFRMKRTSERLGRAGDSVQYHFDEEGIAANGPKGSGSLDWFDQFRVKVTSAALVIIPVYNRFWILPLRQIKSDQKTALFELFSVHGIEVESAQ